MRTALFLTIIIFIVTACTAQPEQQAALLPLPVQTPFSEPDNAAFMQAVSEFIIARGGPANTRYEFTRIDLNNDRRRDGIVLMKSPHQFWCGMNGCEMFIFMATNNQFQLVSAVEPVRGPVIISDRHTNGWKDIVIRISGRSNGITKDVILPFSENGYPQHPERLAALSGGYQGGGVKIFP